MAALQEWAEWTTRKNKKPGHCPGFLFNVIYVINVGNLGIGELMICSSANC
jgi:hypothetical protein